MKHEGRFDVEDRFFVEVCGPCARVLRHALFNDSRLIQLRRDCLSAARDRRVDAECLLYSAVMAWCDNRKGTR